MRSHLELWGWTVNAGLCVNKDKVFLCPKALNAVGGGKLTEFHPWMVPRGLA